MPTALTLHDVVWSRLERAVGVDVYDGEPPASPPYDEDGRVRAYAVLYSSAGRPLVTSLDGNQQSLCGYFQVTCVGGDDRRAMECVDAVRSALHGHVKVDGLTRFIREVEDPGPTRTDTGVWPPRRFVPLDFELYAP